MYSEKRKLDRVPKKNKLTVKPYSDVEKTKLLDAIPAILEDVGTNGICVIADAELPRGARVRVLINLEPASITTTRARLFESDAEAMWVKPVHEEGPYKTGLRFMRTSQADLKIWADFIGKSRTTMF